MYGNGGADQFIFNTKLGSTNVDKIMDFEHDVDKIVLDDVIFKSLTNTLDLNNNFVVGSAALQSDDYLIYNNSNGYLYYDTNGSAGGGQVAFADIGIGMTLTASDFYII
jgi:Ca2+-binding RTX toxin-like protein